MTVETCRLLWLFCNILIITLHIVALTSFICYIIL